MMSLRSRFFVLLPLLVVLTISATDLRAEPMKTERELQPEAIDHFQQHIRPVLVAKCAGCHSEEGGEGVVDFLASQTVTDVATHRGLWASVGEQLRNRTMPPADEEQPSEAERLRIAEWIETTLRRTACDGGDYAPPVTVRRLNRVEYDNTMRDLLGVDLHASEKFPVDGSGGEGFSNNGETLFLPPLLLERYLEAASEALNVAIPSPPQTFDLPRSAWSSNAGTLADADGTLKPKTRVSTFVTIYNAGEYRLRVESGPTKNIEGTLAVQVDGILAERFRLKSGTKDNGDGAEPIEATLTLTRGPHVLSIRNAGETPLTIERIKLTDRRRGPTEAQRETFRTLLGFEFGERPDNPREAAREILAKFLRRAFRRPVEDAEVARYLGLYDRAAERGDPFEESIKLAMKGVLVSSHFLFRIEEDPTDSEPTPINDHELAVRLSYFLWAAPPDDELARLADAGKLQNEDILTAQIDRMLADPKASAFAREFVGGWLGTQEVAASSIPDTGTFKGQFTTELLLDMRDEPIWLFEYLVRKDGSLLDLLDADYGVMTPRLVKHYELKEKRKSDRITSGNGWTPDPQSKRKDPPILVSLPDDRRGGLLGMGGVHLLTSYPNRTSPVLRGGWVLETLLGVRVPAPPPDVPDLKRSKNAKASLRDQLAAHRANASCAACHNLMDPLGFALENFDVLGRWREKDGKHVIDASATLPSGEKFTGPAGLREVLLERRDEFTEHLTEKMLGYALGRSLADRDACTIRRIADRVIEDDYRVRTLIHEVVLSPPFRRRQQME